MIAPGAAPGAARPSNSKRGNTMSFDAFVRSRRITDGARGNFIKDWLKDGSRWAARAPDIASRDELETYLYSRHACSAAIEAGMRLWSEYELSRASASSLTKTGRVSAHISSRWCRWHNQTRNGGTSRLHVPKGFASWKGWRPSLSRLASSSRASRPTQHDHADRRLARPRPIQLHPPITAIRAVMLPLDARDGGASVPGTFTSREAGVSSRFLPIMR